MKIVHIIVGLNNGGAEMMLYKLLKHTDKTEYNIEVISMMDKGLIGNRIEGLGIKVHTLSMKRGTPNFNSLIKAISLCKGAEIIQTWMYHADFLGFLISLFIKPKKLIWGIRHSSLEKGTDKITTLLLAKINAVLSLYPYKIVCNSIDARDRHIEYGYKSKKMVIIPNGFEIDEFFYNKNAKNKLLEELDINRDKKIIGLVARYHKVKDHENFLKAIKMIKNELNEFIVILCGTGIHNGNNDLVKLINQNDVEDIVHLLGRREDMPDIMSALDICVSSSISEAFSNVIGEAMACETPCVVTDVGDSAYIVGKTGIVVQKQNPRELAKGLRKLYEINETKRRDIGRIARERIIKNFNISHIANEYEKIYDI